MPRRPSSVATLLAVMLAACSTTAPSPSPTGPLATAPVTPPASPAPANPGASARPLAEVYAEIRTQVEGIRGLEPVKAVEPVVIDENELARNLEAEFDGANTAAALKDAEDLLITLGLLPAGSSIRELTLAFQTRQVAGYYSPEKDELYVVSRSGVVGPLDEATYAHEFTHQLQDQRFDLDALGIDVADQGDRSLARLALVEGDATSVQTTWMTRHLTAAELGEVFAASLDPTALEAFNNAPAYLRETVLFGYQGGLALVTRLLTTGGYAAVDAAFADPPDSTEQVLHPEKYLAREAPITVAAPTDPTGQSDAGWSVAAEDTLGELLLRTWLTQGGVPSGTAAEAAAGWGGDRLTMLRGPDGMVRVVLKTVWDTPADAMEFLAAARTAATTFHGVVDISVDGRTVGILLGDFLRTSPVQTP